MCNSIAFQLRCDLQSRPWPSANSTVRKPMHIQIAKDYSAMSAQTADFIVSELKQRPDLLLCASAGGTPTGPYEQLVIHRSRQGSLFKKMRVVQIDEWVGPSPSHPATCRYDLRTKL